MRAEGAEGERKRKTDPVWSRGARGASVEVMKETNDVGLTDPSSTFQALIVIISMGTSQSSHYICRNLETHNTHTSHQIPLISTSCRLCNDKLVLRLRL